MNEQRIFGYVATEPQHRTFEARDGRPEETTAGFRVSVETYDYRTGLPTGKTYGVNISVRGKLVEDVVPNLQVGQQVMISGSPSSRTYPDKNIEGAEKTWIELRAREIFIAAGPGTPYQLTATPLDNQSSDRGGNNDRGGNGARGQSGNNGGRGQGGYGNNGGGGRSQGAGNGGGARGQSGGNGGRYNNQDDDLSDVPF